MEGYCIPRYRTPRELSRSPLPGLTILAPAIVWTHRYFDMCKQHPGNTCIQGRISRILIDTVHGYGTYDPEEGTSASSSIAARHMTINVARPMRGGLRSRLDICQWASCSVTRREHLCSSDVHRWRAHISQTSYVHQNAVYLPTMTSATLDIRPLCHVKHNRDHLWPYRALRTIAPRTNHASRPGPHRIRQKRFDASSIDARQCLGTGR